LIALTDAKDIARTHIEELDKLYSAECLDNLVMVAEPIYEGQYGWVFCYDSAQHIQTEDMSYALAGNCPVLIDRHSGQLFELGTALPTEEYIATYLEFGDPHAVPSERVELAGRSVDANSVLAIKAIRATTGMGLAASKRIIDECETGEPAIVECNSVDDAAELCGTLTALGFEIQRIKQ